MLKLTSRKALTISILVIISPFFLISIYSFFYIKFNAENSFKDTMFRYTKNNAHASIEATVRNINTLFNSLPGLLDKENINDYIAPGYSELNSLIPSLINASDMFSSVLISDSNNLYKIYPKMELGSYKPSERPWFPTEGMKDKVYFSAPYVSVSKKPEYNHGVNAITVSMNLFDRHSEFVGNIAFDLNLTALSYILQGQNIPYNGHFKVVAMDGSVIMYSNTKEIFARKVPALWINEVKESSGYFRDEANKKIVFYQAYQNPDWVAFTSVNLDDYNRFLNDSYIVLIYVMLGCIICYLIMAIIARIYFKQWIDMLYANINDTETNDNPRNLEGLCKGIAKKNETLKEAVQAATTDSLTKIGSRRKFELDTLNLFNSGTPFHLAMIDLDNFKKINDTWGHQTGDSVLQTVSRIGFERLGDVHSIYRFGGEELVALICDLTFAECYELIDSWRYTVAHRKWREQDLTVSFSCGIASSSECSSIDEIVSTADKFLYQAKESGKNCIYPPLS